MQRLHDISGSRAGVRAAPVAPEPARERIAPRVHDANHAPRDGAILYALARRDTARFARRSTEE